MTDTRLILTCVPVRMAPNLPAIATYSTYTQVPCPLCKQLMWLGERGRVQVEHGGEMECMICTIMQAKERGIDPETIKIEKLHDDKAGSA